MISCFISSPPSCSRCILTVPPFLFLRPCVSSSFASLSLFSFSYFMPPLLDIQLTEAYTLSPTYCLLLSSSLLDPCSLALPPFLALQPLCFILSINNSLSIHTLILPTPSPQITSAAQFSSFNPLPISPFLVNLGFPISYSLLLPYTQMFAGCKSKQHCQQYSMWLQPTGQCQIETIH